MKETTKHRILEAGAELVHRQGFNHTGISEVLHAAGVPKGSFYFYFKSKEDFGLALINHFRDTFARMTMQFLDDQSIPHLKRLRKVFAWFLDYFAQHGFERGCPVGNLAQEMSDLSPAFRESLADAIQGMTQAMTQCLRNAQKDGELSPRHDPDELARFIVSAWEGSLILMKVEKGPEAMELFDRMVFDHLLK
jgi:TetR/AcrR family transcriptional repressor of nem operon